jgi:hypothetical protein
MVPLPTARFVSLSGTTGEQVSAAEWPATGLENQGVLTMQGFDSSAHRQ